MSTLTDEERALGHQHTPHRWFREDADEWPTLTAMALREDEHRVQSECELNSKEKR